MIRSSATNSKFSMGRICWPS